MSIYEIELTVPPGPVRLVVVQVWFVFDKPGFVLLWLGGPLYRACGFDMAKLVERLLFAVGEVASVGFTPKVTNRLTGHSFL